VSFLPVFFQFDSLPVEKKESFSDEFLFVCLFVSFGGCVWDFDGFCFGVDEKEGVWVM
jgi:hypothetical protein